MLDNGFVAIHRSLLNWEWYDDINTTRLFIHLLITVNWFDNSWHGIKIERGSRVTSIQHLADETGLTIRAVRTALDKLKMTNEVTSKTTNRYTIISVVNYDVYQGLEKEERQAKQQAKRQAKRQSNDNQTTIKRQQINNNNNNNNITIYKHFQNEDVNNIFLEFLEQRKENKVKNTDRAIKLLVNKLNEYDDATKVSMINNSIMNNWKGIFPINNAGTKKNNNKITNCMISETDYSAFENW